MNLTLIFDCLKGIISNSNDPGERKYVMCNRCLSFANIFGNKCGKKRLDIVTNLGQMF